MLKQWIEQEGKWQWDIVKRPSKWNWYAKDVEPPSMLAFTVLKHQEVVDRRFGRYRRMSKDYEYLSGSSEAMIYLTMIWLMPKRLARNELYGIPSRQRLGLTGAARAF